MSASLLLCLLSMRRAVILNCFPLYFLRWGLSLNLQSAISQTGWLSVSPSPTSSVWGRRAWGWVQLWMCVLGIQTEVLMPL